MDKPVCTIIAGPNGAGKTTFALKYLREVEHCLHFVNADLIADGLSPLNPQSEWFAASRLFLREISQYIQRRQSFAFESTLSGKSYLKLIRDLRDEGWFVRIIYLWLPSIDQSIERVRERVGHGGHDIPVNTVQRRFPRSLRNFMKEYSPVCDLAVCFENSASDPDLIFSRSEDGMEIVNKKFYDTILEMMR